MKHKIWMGLLLLSGITAVAQKTSLNKKEAKMEQQIIQTITSIFNGADERNWKKIQQAMADSVWVDFSSMSGEKASSQTPEQITEAWAALLPGFDKTHHQLSDFVVTVNDKKATAHYTGKADHFIKKDVWTVEGSYDTELEQKDNCWLVTKHQFNLAKQSGNKELPARASAIVKAKTARRVEFKSEGLILVGTLHLPQNFSENKIYKGIIVTGSWTTVKEQMPDLYARKLAHLGFVALTFDFRNYGESEGQPRNYEVPQMKGQDILNATHYLKTLSFIDKENIGGLAICASAGYMALAVTNGADLKAVNFVAPWLHNAELVKPLYGGEEGVKEKIRKSDEARNRFEQSGKADYVPAISTTNKEAAMFGEWDYYLNPKRGAIKEWGNQWAVMAWKGWLEFDPISYASNINIPLQIIHSRGAAIPEGAELFYKGLKGPKNIIWVDKPTQFDFYDGEPFTTNAAKDAAGWFHQHLD